MKKRILAFLLVLCMAITLLAACGSDEITPEKAQKIVLNELGLTQSEANPHVHIGEHEGKPCYSVYVTVNGENWEYLVDSTTGEILDYHKSSHSH